MLKKFTSPFYNSEIVSALFISKSKFIFIKNINIYKLLFLITYRVSSKTHIINAIAREIIITGTMEIGFS